jgi:hypothetical protein
MRWEQIREQYPGHWLLVEAVAAHSAAGQRHLDDLAVIQIFPDAQTAMGRYRTLHRSSPQRELYVLHTDRERLDIQAQSWLGIRAA